MIRGEDRRMVPSRFSVKRITSESVVLLANEIASLREPLPESNSVETTKVSAAAMGMRKKQEITIRTSVVRDSCASFIPKSWDREMYKKSPA